MWWMRLNTKTNMSSRRDSQDKSVINRHCLDLALFLTTRYERAHVTSIRIICQKNRCTCLWISTILHFTALWARVVFEFFVYETLDFIVIKTTNLNWIVQFQTDVQSYSGSFVITTTNMTENLSKRVIVIICQ